MQDRPAYITDFLDARLRLYLTAFFTCTVSFSMSIGTSSIFSSFGGLGDTAGVGFTSGADILDRQNNHLHIQQSTNKHHHLHDHYRPDIDVCHNQTIDCCCVIRAVQTANRYICKIVIQYRSIMTRVGSITFKMYFNYKIQITFFKVIQILFSITLAMTGKIQNTFLESN